MCDVTRLAKRNAANAVHSTRHCIGPDCLPRPPPGRRPRTSASSSPTAYAMYVSNSVNTGMTQQHRITPPGGYSNTFCCDESTGADVNREVCGGGPKTPFGCCTYRGRGVRPNKNWSPSQLAPWRMSPAPNQMQRIGNVQPPSTANVPRMVRASPIVGTPGLKGQPSDLSSSEYLSEVKQSANYTGPCPMPPGTPEHKPKCKTVTQTVAVYSGSRLRNCTSAVDCPVVRKSDNARFTGTGVQRFSTANMPTVSVCPNPELYESCKC